MGACGGIGFQFLFLHVTMGSRIDEPVQLGQFSKRGKGDVNLYLYRDAPGEDAITVAVDGVGIRSVQVSSKTKGEEQEIFAEGFKFFSPAATVIHSDQIQRTYAAAVRSNDAEKSKSRKILSVWSRPVENLSDGLTYAQLKLGSQISRIHSVPNSDRVVVVHEDGAISVVSTSLDVLVSQSAPKASEDVLESWVFRTEECAFVSQSVGECIVMVLGKVRQEVWLCFFGLRDDGVEAIGCVLLDRVDASNVASVSCSEDGFMSILDSNGLCSTFTLSGFTSLAATPLPSPLQFQGLVVSTESAPLAIHALAGSTMVLAGITITSPPKLALLMWDTQYSTLLAERIVPLPSPSDSASSISVSGSTSKHLTITLCSTILGASITPPTTSTIASALISTSTSASTSTQWLSPIRIEDDTRSALVDRIRRDVLAGRAAQADSAFFRWVEAAADANAEAEGTLASATKAAAKIPFPSAFAAALVDAAFPPPSDAGKEKDKKGDEGPDFASGVISALIWRGAAGQGMIRHPGGLYGELRKRRDWPIMLSALQHVPDIPEDEIVATIQDLLIPQHANPSNPLTNGPTLQNGLAHLLAYPTSPAPLRLALRNHLRDAEDIERVLKIIDAWLKRGLQFDVWELDGLQAFTTTKPGKGKTVGVSTSSGRKKVKGAGMVPALEDILAFAQALLDTHLLTLLQHRPAHALLRSISTSLAPLPAYNDNLQTLSAPLAPFATEDALEHKTTERTGNTGGWLAKEEYRKQRREKFAAEAIAIGEYRFEELVL
ncbi:hypothetical protein FRC07_010347 [Ceratobasidium sp. 392]|nr:hypothetical protein FRC07_010347 [Ceratobasidium sp. 392]